MLPILLKIPLPFLDAPLEIRSYGVLIALGFLIMLPLVSRQAHREGISSNTIVDLGFWSLLWGIVGARILFILTTLHEYKEYPLEIFYIWKGGLVFYGGLIGGTLALIYYCKKHKLNLWQVMDLGALGVTFTHMFGRMGCLAAGCCFGHPTTLPWGIIFHKEESFARPLHTPLHPTQIYEIVFLGLLFLFFYFYLARNKKFQGQVVLTYLSLYGVARFIIEFFRGDDIRGFVIPNLISTSQFVSIIIFLISLAFLVNRLYKK
ncbi:MAG TPA: prolipoprotein diacylglyceryl transferase [Bdellovibrionota bacterium]|nr:prolipoprotein diacylglyceryl transferase [Bdellovibrionota bacterium]